MKDTPRKRPRQQRSRDTVDALLEAAAQVFEREGAEATTNRIAERAGFSIGTLYQYFPHKQAMLRALAERHIAEGHSRLAALSARLAEEKPDWPGTVRAFATEFAVLHTERPHLHAVLYELTPRSPEGVAALRALHDAAVAEVAVQLRRTGVEEGAGAERTAALLVHTADATLHRVLLGDQDAAEALTSSLLALRPATRNR
ncbi:hypothetical protein BAY61_06225 [Prauserella marina]|uniref:DNA-binding transcriptional regulator, AcrR family n=1 Tax=Prauserella marina TaxID=530584 RepID=A0A222VL86_9PSEU|nr:TetR/AcrR family transcriptional regulator [Prauserella marina]ASR34647.1 hypothetical protein BAY61_06225 [Prauserella marina]PWV85709.1 TetR family transcriptional regulator [Prauserella marina]SDC47699.1 DNA-binding transcriptional regulator, AcrR family [Prauserella marina]